MFLCSICRQGQGALPPKNPKRHRLSLRFTPNLRECFPFVMMPLLFFAGIFLRESSRSIVYKELICEKLP